MFWLIFQVWLLLLIGFVLGCAVAWLAARLFLKREDDAFADLEGKVL